MICLSSCSRAAVSDHRTSEAQRRGQGLYALWCAPCHNTSDLNLVKDPPNLAGLFLRQTLPSGAPATDEQVRKTISDGRGIMPPFQQSLNADEVDDLMRFLHSLGNSSNSDVMRAQWKHLRNMFIPMVAAMPEDKYDFRPTKTMRSFLQLVMQAIEANYTNMGYVAGKKQEETESLAAKYKNLRGRTAILDALEDSYDYGDMILASMNDQNTADTVTAKRGDRTTRFDAALQAFEDNIGQYGTLVVYLQLNGVVPPEATEDEVPPSVVLNLQL